MIKRRNRRKTPLKRFVSDKRAASVVLTTLIITAGVVAAGIAVLYWAYSWGNIANQEYSNTIVSNQNATSEKVAFEYSYYSSGKLTVYMINCGDVANVSIARIYIWDNFGDLKGTYTPDTGLKNISTDTLIPGNTLSKGDEGYITITTNPALASGYYTFRVVTERGRNFDSSFKVA